MPTIKGAFKRMKTSAKSRISNRERRGPVASLRRQLDEAVAKGDASLSRDLLAKYVSALDKAAKKGAIKKNAADRRKSRMTLKVAALKG
ncbi:MAG: 30S ribosomal protein S20 [Lentisphaerae bacterium]|nr:30S ribosomal protein S20 [Lentisphaerota bacterium]